MKTTLRKNFGERIRQIRKSRGLTQEEVADRAGMDYKYFGSVERGERNITIDNIQRIAEAFGFEAHQLFLFSLGGKLKPEKAVTENKVKDLLERCNSRKKELILKVIANIAGWDE